jgi:hypothetical protein
VRTSDKGLSQGFFSRSSRDCSNSLIWLAIHTKGCYRFFHLMWLLTEGPLF